MTHKQQDCLKRPRKKGTMYANRDIAPDEVIQHIKACYDAKRDWWNRYDLAKHKKLYEEYEVVSIGIICRWTPEHGAFLLGLHEGVEAHELCTRLSNMLERIYNVKLHIVDIINSQVM